MPPERPPLRSKLRNKLKFFGNRRPSFAPIGRGSAVIPAARRLPRPPCNTRWRPNPGHGGSQSDPDRRDFTAIRPGRRPRGGTTPEFARSSVGGTDERSGPWPGARSDRASLRQRPRRHGQAAGGGLSRSSHRHRAQGAANPRAPAGGARCRERGLCDDRRTPCRLRAHPLPRDVKVCWVSLRSTQPTISDRNMLQARPGPPAGDRRFPTPHSRFVKTNPTFVKTNPTRPRTFPLRSTERQADSRCQIARLSLHAVRPINKPGRGRHPPRAM